MLVILYLHLSFAYIKPHHASLAPEARFAIEQEKPQPRILIISLPRSGSTFLGEIFNQNPEAAYLYEMSRGLGEAFEVDGCSETPEAWASDMVKRMFDCDFAPLIEYMEKVSKTKGPREYIYTWAHSQTQSSPDKCQANATKVLFSVKEITMWGPKLKWLLSTVGKQLRIIWLVRDIRGFVSSWIPFKAMDRTENMYFGWGLNKKDLWERYDDCRWPNDTLQKEANETLKNLLSNLKAPPHQRMAAWWATEQRMMMNFLSELPAENWMLVRYEDFSRFPLEVAQQVYSFVGKNILHTNVIRWLFQNTQSGNVTVRYGTARDSSSMATVWMQRIPDAKLREIEDIGAPLFDYFGYTRITSDKQAILPAIKTDIYYRI